MAQIIAGTDAINTQVFPAADIRLGDVLSTSSTRVTVLGAFTGTRYNFFGTGFTFSDTSVTGGRVTRYTEDDGLRASLAPSFIDAVRFFRDLRASDFSRIPRFTLAGDDSIRGSRESDIINAFNADDSVTRGRRRYHHWR